jgi:mannose-6-phosphate isomerase-like protein (cupin superfamily)
LSERTIVCADLRAGIDDLERGGFRLDCIYPADEPYAALLSKGGESVRLTSRPDAPPPRDSLPAFVPKFLVTRADMAAGQGRAGMLYRDLIPGRLGGRYVASHITIAEGGPVADWVHFHRIAVQMIVVRRGWARVVYEDQGDPFAIREGDLVLQPPRIRHRVLESSAGFEAIEIGAPALHATVADHELSLPNGRNPERLFGGQRFLHHVAAQTGWTPFGGGEAQETGLSEATGGLAEARMVRPGAAANVDFPAHDGELVFGFVLDGSATLDFPGGGELRPADAVVIPPGKPWRLTGASPDLRLLHLTTARLD